MIVNLLSSTINIVIEHVGRNIVDSIYDSNFIFQHNIIPDNVT